ncbi:hypothetical protein G7Z17_g267 [Cylindrodendrum hubeiense]|uniref:Uncharacterized protein n=1 Tax=Cylindrodendrum hubeiense TaxID=595255 RepID=A0A9P5HH83_9HYPO|nr:hypothetical protein G7Z17_g267 [Cylindrodendrum hubeiense]
MTSITSHLQQIHIGLNHPSYEPVAHYETKNTTYALEHDKLEASLLGRCPAHLWPHDSYNTACPRPILINKHHQQQLDELQEALNAAIVDIVQRWWSDRYARFPERMPLEKREEELLQWLEGQISCGNLNQFPSCLGSWRPDFLVEDSQDGAIVENFRITEINARFSFNGFMHQAYGQQALDDMGVGAGLTNATDSEKLLKGLFTLFKPNVPLHLLKGEERGIDIHMFIDVFRRRFGITPRLITPADLRLLPDPQSKSGFRLCCVVRSNGGLVPLTSPAFITTEGEVVEEIHQVGLELHQRELMGLEPEMLRQVSLRCFNDMRTILLVHDKRMLGIVKQELRSLVARKVLTPAQSQVLDKGIVDTILPASPELENILQASKDSPDVKDKYILKPIRGGKGAGIVFGDEITPEEWIDVVLGCSADETRRRGSMPLSAWVSSSTSNLHIPAKTLPFDDKYSKTLHKGSREGAFKVEWEKGV